MRIRVVSMINSVIYEMDWSGPYEGMPTREQVRDAFAMKHPDKEIADFGIDHDVDRRHAVEWVEVLEDEQT